MAETISAVLRLAAAALDAAGIEDAALEARLLLAHALGVSRETLLDRNRLIDTEGFGTLLARRLTREPLAYITGERGFWSFDLAVSPATLIPRPDSETLITAAQAHGREVRRILDLGTGTGCLLLAALAVFPGSTGVGIDVSPDAARLAADNAARTGLADRADFLAGDWDSAIDARFDLVLSNPPYIPHADIASLMPEVARHEPATALDGGADGLEAYRRILPRLPCLLTPGGIAVLELGQGQDVTVPALATTLGLRVIALHADLGGIPRALVLAGEKTFGSPSGKD